MLLFYEKISIILILSEMLLDRRQIWWSCPDFP